jgi:glyoxalase superfamily protein
MYVGSVVIDCNDLPRCTTSGGRRSDPREAPEEGWAVLQDPEHRRVNVSLQKVPEPRAGKNRLHFDLYTNDQADEVARLRASVPPSPPRQPSPSAPAEIALGNLIW